MDTHSIIKRCLLALCCSGLLFVTGCASSNFLTERQSSGLHRAGFHKARGGWEFELDGRILFATDQASLTQQNRAIVGRVIRSLRRLNIRYIQIEGYADSTGTYAYNEDLSFRRATSVAREFERYGWPRGNLKVRGYGSDYPVANNASARGRAQNRRVVIVVPY